MKSKTAKIESAGPLNLSRSGSNPRKREKYTFLAVFLCTVIADQLTDFLSALLEWTRAETSSFKLWITFVVFGMAFALIRWLRNQKDACEVREAFSGRLIHRLRGPRVQDAKNGNILLGNADWIYTQNNRGEVQRWRVR